MDYSQKDILNACYVEGMATAGSTVKTDMVLALWNSNDGDRHYTMVSTWLVAIVIRTMKV